MSGVTPEQYHWYIKALAKSMHSAVLVMQGENSPTGAVPRLDLTATIHSCKQAFIDLAAAGKALGLLIDGVPLSAHFPDGSRAPEFLTPRQVNYLRDLADVVTKQANQALNRDCGATKVDGTKCAGRSMHWTDRAVCRAHATPAEVAENTARRDQQALDFETREQDCRGWAIQEIKELSGL